jgi:phenylalanyl-tRNA synthetase beta chain
MVDTGNGKPVQVVCGAPNARAGMIGAFAAPGTYVPAPTSRCRSARSAASKANGMMCSERELQLSEEHDGIIDLPD